MSLEEGNHHEDDTVRSDDPVQAASAMFDLGELAEELGRLDEARSWYERARSYSGRPISVLRPV